MARDYKRAAQKKKKRKKPIPGWLLFVAGLSIGLFATFLVFLQDRSSVLPGEQAVTKTRPPVTDVDPDVVTEKKKTRKPEQEQVRKGGTNKEKNEPAPPRFDFYTILPELEVIIPDEEIRMKKPRTKNETVEVKKSGSYILQAGSFKRHDQADRRKAKLALLGVSATIQRVTILDNEVWYRVKIGPFNDLKRVNNIRTKLFKNDINAIPLKVRPEK
jgi:cell division protein FtsN